MRQFFHLVLVGLRVGSIICLAPVFAYVAFAIVDGILHSWLSVKTPLFDQIFGIYDAIFYYPLIAFSIQIGQIYSFLFYRRRQIKNKIPN